MTPTQLRQLLLKTIPAGEPVLVTGAPGIGKSQIVEQAAAECGADYILSHPSVSDPTDVKGLPWISAKKDHATFLPFGELARALDATEMTVWMLDDLGQATPAVQASYMQLLLARRVNGHVLPDCVSFVAATNRRTDRAGVSGILEPVKSRFATIVELTADVDDWSQWAYGHNVPATLIAFIRYRPELLSDFRPTADMSNSPCPRTWSHVSRIESLGLPRDVEAIAISGAVGEGPAAEYLAFRTMAESLVTVDEILLNPDRAAIPGKPNEMYAVCCALAARANEQNLGRIGKYCERLVDGQQGEFAALTLRDMHRRNDKLLRTPDGVKIACGKLGKLISGQVD